MLVVFAALLAVAPGVAAAATITSDDSPLTEIEVGTMLNCGVRHAGDTSPEFFAGTACGTLVATGDVLYGPEAIPAGDLAAPRTPFVELEQTGPTGPAPLPTRSGSRRRWRRIRA